MGELFSVLLKVLYFLIVFGIIILLAYYTTKVVGKRVSVNAGSICKCDTLYLGGDRSLIIVKVKDDYLLMSGSTGNGACEGTGRF